MRLLEDILDDMGRAKTNAAAIVYDSGISREYPSPEKFDLLFRIKYDNNNFPNPLFRLGYFASLDNNNIKEHLDRITDYIITSAETSRFADKISEVIFTSSDSRLVNLSPQFRITEEGELGWEPKTEPETLIYVVFAVRVTVDSSLLRRAAGFVEKLFRNLSGLIFIDYLLLKVTGTANNVWQTGTQYNSMWFNRFCFEFLKNRGGSNPTKKYDIDSTGKYYTQWFNFSEAIFGAKNSFVLPAMRNLFSGFDVAARMFDLVFHKQMKHYISFDKIKEHLPSDGIVNLAPLLRYALNRKRIT